jgi:hypothetical protein
MTNHRFVVDREDYVVDTSNSNPKVPIFTVYDTREKSLRESVLFRRVNEFVDKLLVNNNPLEDCLFGESYQPANPENFSLSLGNLLCGKGIVFKCTRCGHVPEI